MQAKEPEQAWIKLEDVSMMPRWLIKRLRLSFLPTSCVLAIARFEGTVSFRFGRRRRHRLNRLIAETLDASLTTRP